MWKKGIFGVLLLLIVCRLALAQQDGHVSIEAITAPGQVKPIDLKERYGLNPDSVYKDYLNQLLEEKKYPEAEKVVQNQIKLHLQDKLLHIDLGTVYSHEKKDAQAREEFDIALNGVNGDDMLTQRLAKAFIAVGNLDYAIMVYERATQLIGVAYYYSGPLARLYAQCGEIGKAIDVVLIPIPGMGTSPEQVKAVLLELLGSDPAKLQLMQKALIVRINEDPSNNFYADLLTWVYMQKDDWEGALIQMEALDERNQEGNRHVLDLARMAATARQYDIAHKAYDEVIAKGKDEPGYMIARSEKLKTGMTQLRANAARKPEDIESLRTQFDTFLKEYPKYYSQQAAADYATLEAQYGGNVKKAVTILKRAIEEPDTRRAMAGKFKLQLGDYYVLLGRLWDASLTYSQVDKDFMQDEDGEDARFRNAKLAYYRGDFEWAQRQLGRLKSATSQLIANDAIDLSVQITENVEDSNTVPLQRFAHAGLLEFQNKDEEAGKLLDSLNEAFPKHPLNDDILMMRADMALKHNDYNKAIGYLKAIYEQYSQDVLGDDAVFTMAEIYFKDLNDKAKAKELYENLIVYYPGSTYVQVARQRLREIANPIVP